MEVTNKPGPRGRAQFHVVADPDKGDLHLFSGDAIPGVVTVLSRRYIRQGKWSHTQWEIDLAKGVELQTLYGGIKAETWDAAIREVLWIFQSWQTPEWLRPASPLRAGMEAAAERLIRDEFPAVAERLDEASLQSASTRVGKDTLRAERDRLLARVAQIDALLEQP